MGWKDEAQDGTFPSLYLDGKWQETASLADDRMAFPSHDFLCVPPIDVRISPGAAGMSCMCFSHLTISFRKLFLVSRSLVRILRRISERAFQRAVVPPFLASLFRNVNKFVFLFPVVVVVPVKFRVSRQCNAHHLRIRKVALELGGLTKVFGLS